MDTKKIIFPAFILLVLVQLFVPAKMILDQEDILKNGTAYKFRTTPIDPYDPFRGKYVWLGFEDNWIEVDTADGWTYYDDVYVELEKDGEGFAKIKAVSKSPMEETKDYLKATVNMVVNYEKPPKLYVDYPFDRFYMDEFKAKPAEDIVREASRDTNSVSHALVRVQDGRGVIENVYIDDVPLREVVEKQQ